MDQRPTILLTGFGPFPDMPTNVSARYARDLADRLGMRLPGHRCHALVLPTEWQSGPSLVRQVYRDEAPALALHFGVSREALGFEIERLAQNLAAPRADAAGITPDAPCLYAGGPRSRPARLPVDVILQRLHARGLPARASDDAGAYICNAVMYEALASCESTSCMSGFVHIPSRLGPDGPLDWTGAIEGGLTIALTCLEHLSSREVNGN